MTARSITHFTPDNIDELAFIKTRRDGRSRIAFASGIARHALALLSIRPLHPAGRPRHIRSDNGPEFVAKAVQEWIAAVGAKTAYIERPWENGYIESFNARLRDELLNGEIFYTLREAQIVIESWRSGLTPQSDTSHQHQRCLHSPSGRLRYADRLRRPRWRNRQR
jgi:transposase InsO family protein